MYVMRHLIWLILLFVSLAGHAVSGSPTTRVVVRGRIDNIAPGMSGTITAIDCNPSGIGSGRHAVRVDSTGRFETFVDMPFGHNFTIYYNGGFMCVCAEPGDTLILEIDAAHGDVAPKCSGNHARLNNEYSDAYARLFKTFYGNALPPKDTPVEQFMDALMTVYDSKLHAIRQYADSVNMGEDSRSLLEKTALFTLANDAADFSGRSAEEALAFFSAPVFGLDDPDNLREMMFPYHLSAYLRWLVDVVGTGKAADVIDAVVKRHPSSINRDVMFVMLSDMGLFPDYEIDKDLFADTAIYDAIYGDKNHLESLPAHEVFKSGLYRYSHGALEEIRCTSIVGLLQKEYKDKLVYMDFWATWCGPCIAANKELPAVAEFFKDNDIVFVSIAMKSDIDKWKEHVDGLPANCHSYIVTDDDAAELIMSDFKMSGFPSYRIIGHGNTVINNDPPRPNSPSIYDLLSRLIEK